MEPDDGRILWPWRKCDLLIIDDLDAGVDKTGSAVLQDRSRDGTWAKAVSSIKPEYISDRNCAGSQATTTRLPCLRYRRSVWIVGDRKARHPAGGFPSRH